MSRLVVSLVGSFHGQCRWARWTGERVAGVSVAWCAILVPLPRAAACVVGTVVDRHPGRRSGHSAPQAVSGVGNWCGAGSGLVAWVANRPFGTAQSDR